MKCAAKFMREENFYVSSLITSFSVVQVVGAAWFLCYYCWTEMAIACTDFLSNTKKIFLWSIIGNGIIQESIWKSYFLCLAIYSGIQQMMQLCPRKICVLHSSIDGKWCSHLEIVHFVSWLQSASRTSSKILFFSLCANLAWLRIIEQLLQEFLQSSGAIHNVFEGWRKTSVFFSE
jgi:hypothetical protein